MKSSELNSAIIGKSNSSELAVLIHEEVSQYTSLSKKVGSSIPIIFIEDEAVNINANFLKRLLNEILIGKLNNIHLAYICDCLTLGEYVCFENENLQKIIFDIADPEINGGYKSNFELNKFIDSIEFM